MTNTCPIGQRGSTSTLAVATGAALATEEDWQLSQFWYSEATSRSLAGLVQSLARRAVATAGAQPRAAVVACLSCPSVFKALRALLDEEAKREMSSSSSVLPLSSAAAPPDASHVAIRAHVLEFDRRFSVFGEEAFAFYDYNAPLALPPALLGACDVIVLDPPFLNRDCLAAFAHSVAALRAPGARVVLCTGAVRIGAARELLGVRPTRAEVLHSSGRLSNPFSVYVDGDEADGAFLGGFDVEAERAAETASAAEATTSGQEAER